MTETFRAAERLVQVRVTNIYSANSRAVTRLVIVKSSANMATATAVQADREMLRLSVQMNRPDRHLLPLP